VWDNVSSSQSNSFNTGTRSSFLVPSYVNLQARSKLMSQPLGRWANRCTIEVRGATVRAIFIAQRKLNSKGVHRRNYVPEVPIEDCLFIGKNRSDKRFARWPERQNASVHGELVRRRVGLRRLWNVAEQFQLAATAQNLKRLARHLTQKRSPDPSTALGSR
jgi:hypothetical protein